MAEPGRPCLAVDIGGTSTRVAVVRGTTVSDRTEIPTEAERGPDDLVERLTVLLQGIRPENGAWPVGVSCTGRVDRGRVTAVNTATMPGWNSFPLQDRLAAQFGPAVHVMNDAKAATLAEWTAWCGHEQSNFLFVTVSTGIGSGLVLGGQLHHARYGQDIGLGFTRIAGEAQYLEHVASGRALNRLAVSAGYGSVRTLFDTAEADSSAARAVLDGPLTELARHLLNAHCLLGLDRICLGGSVGLRSYTQTVLTAQLRRWSQEAPEIHAAVHGADAGLIGAALSALEGDSP